MNITIDSKDLLTIAEQIQYNCNMLSLTDAEDAESDVDFYVPVIRQLADELQELTEHMIRKKKLEEKTNGKK